MPDPACLTLNFGIPYLPEISKKVPNRYAKTIRQHFIRYSHSIQLDECLALNGRSISLLIGGAKQGDKNFCAVVPSSGLKLDFADLLQYDSRVRRHPLIGLSFQ
jgi:hypothetical protein